MNEENNFFRDNLRYLRQEKGLNLVECGAPFGLSKSAISLYENGHSYPPVIIARRISEYFGKSLTEMFEKDIRPNPPPRLKPVADGDTEGATKESAGSAAAVGLKQPAAAESPPGELAEMKVQMLEWMLKLEKHGVK